MFGRKNDPLDAPVLHFNEHDHLTMRGLLDGGLVILGRPGCGKSSSIGLQASRGILRSGAGVLWLSSSPTDLAMVTRLCHEAGRSDDLIVVGPNHAPQFNLTNYLVGKLRCDARETSKCVMQIGERQDNDESQSGGGGDKFWTTKPRQTVQLIVELVRQVTGGASMVDIANCLDSCANEPSELGSEKYRSGFQYQCFQKAQDNLAKIEDPKARAIAARNLENARMYLYGEWPVMADKTRSSVVAIITAVFAGILSGDVWWHLSQGTDVTPDALNDGAVIFVDASAGEHGSSGIFLENSWRTATQKMVLKRDPNNWDRAIIIFYDEMGRLVNSGDVFYATESRKFGGSTVALAQSVRSFEAGLAGERGKAQAELLLGCFAHKAILACDVDTGEYGVKLAGKAYRNNRTYSPRPDKPLLDMLWRGGFHQVSSSEHLENVIEARQLMHGQRTGGARNKFLCDAAIFKSGEPFSTGDNHLFCSFSQR